MIGWVSVDPYHRLLYKRSCGIVDYVKPITKNIVIGLHRQVITSRVCIRSNHFSFFILYNYIALARTAVVSVRTIYVSLTRSSVYRLVATCPSLSNHV